MSLAELMKKKQEEKEKEKQQTKEEKKKKKEKEKEKCPFCERSFVSLNRHLPYCRLNPENQEEKTEVLKSELKESLGELESPSETRLKKSLLIEEIVKTLNENKEGKSPVPHSILRAFKLNLDLCLIRPQIDKVLSLKKKLKL